MPLRMAITKQSGQGEQLVYDVCQWNPVTGEIAHDSIAEMSAILDEALQGADLRMQEMNLRMLEAYQMEQYFTQDVWQKITQILDILAGRQSAAQVVQRWQAALEETQELEQAREQYRMQQLDNNGLVNDTVLYDAKDY